VSVESKPNAYRQCTATGTLASTASLPDHTCAVLIHAGARPPSSPYIANAEPNWKSASTIASVAIHVLTAIPLEKPATLIEKKSE